MDNNNDQIAKIDVSVDRRDVMELIHIWSIIGLVLLPYVPSYCKLWIQNDFLLLKIEERNTEILWGGGQYNITSGDV